MLTLLQHVVNMSQKLVRSALTPLLSSELTTHNSVLTRSNLIFATKTLLCALLCKRHRKYAVTTSGNVGHCLQYASHLEVIRFTTCFTEMRS